jgi:hypothetical protein
MSTLAKLPSANPAKRLSHQGVHRMSASTIENPAHEKGAARAAPCLSMLIP